MLLPLLLLMAGPVPAAPAGDLDPLVKTFVDVLGAVQRSAADPVSDDQLIYSGAIPGLLRTLDPHSIFFDPQQYEQVKQMEHSEQKGFGTVVSVLPGRVIVLQALPGTPSAQSGLSPGDEILAVNNVALSRLEFDQIVEYLGMARQHQVELVVRRPGSVRLLNFTLKPALMDAPSVDREYLLRPGFAYVRATSFDPQTGKLIKDAIEKLGGAKLKGLVLDLRGNPGGVVEAALETASLFLQPGQKILSIRGRSVKSQDVEVPKTATPYVFPVAVLVNEKTASAAEIVSGALQDHDRAVILGVPTYGKGLVQSVYPLSSETAMALTTAFYYTPSGRSIQRPLKSGNLQIAHQTDEFETDSGRYVAGGGGIQPDIVIAPVAPTRLEAALDGSGVISSFAIDYTRKHKVDASYRVPASVLDDFEAYASDRGIQPGVDEWSADISWIESRLNEEIVTQVSGFAAADQVAAGRDVGIQRALDAIAK